MPKSVNEYYSEKMKRLLELENQKNVGRLSSPTAGGQAQRNVGRGYYEDFRKKVGTRDSHDGHIKVQKSIAGAPGRQKPQDPRRPSAMCGTAL